MTRRLNIVTTLLVLFTNQLYAESLSTPLSAQAISPHCTVIDVGGNNVIVAGYGDQLAIVDGGEARHADTLLAFLQSHFDNREVAALFNTHWHPQQTGLNYSLGQQGVPIIAHKITRQWLGSFHYNVWENRRIEPLPDVALPTKTFYQKHELKVGGAGIQAGYLLLAHTDNDIYVYFPEDNVLAIGGVLRSDRWPTIDWWSAGWYGGMLDGLETLLEIADDDTVIVPAHGPVMSKAQLQKEYDMYVILFDRLLALLKASNSPAEAVAANPTDGFHPEWNNPQDFVESAFRSYYGHLRGEKRMGLMP